MKQEQEQFQESLRRLLASAKENGQKLTAGQVNAFFEEQNLTPEQRALVLEYLEMEQIDAQETGGIEKKKKDPTPLSEEEERFLRTYLEELREPESLTDGRKQELFRAAAGGDEDAKACLLEYYMPKIPELAREIHDGTLFFGDLVQEGNVSLLVALGRIDPEDPENRLLEEIRGGMGELLEEYHIRKHQDETVVHKVNRLKEAIEELSDGEEMNFSVAELSAYLEMSVEEIEDILRVAGEEQ